MRRLFIAAAILTLLPAGSGSAQTGASGSHERAAPARAGSAELAKTILDLETRRIGAMVKKDLATLDRLLGEELTYTHSGGSIDTKASFITLIKERGRYLGVDYVDPQVVPLTAGTAMVRGSAVIRLEGTAPYTVLFLDVWARRNDAWQMVAWQATRVPPVK